MKRLIAIDADLWQASQAYVRKQMAVMKKFGSAPVLTDERYKKLVYDCAVYPQTLRNMRRKVAAA